MKLSGLWRSTMSRLGFRKTIVLGMEHARAAEAERRRLLRRDLAPSPIPAGTYSRRESSLVNPAEIARDAAIRDVVRTYRAADATQRESMRDSISKDEIYELFTFARRAAVFGMRGRDRTWIEDGLAAVAMMDAARMDPRDLGLALGPLRYAAARTGAGSRPMFDAAAGLASAYVRDAFRVFTDDDEDVGLDAWMLEEIPTGFIEVGDDDGEYEPTHDLTSAIIAIADVLDADRYAVSGVTIKDMLPDVWIKGSAALLEEARGGASVHAGAAKGLLLFLVETRDAAAAEALRAAAARQTDPPMIGIARGDLFCLLTARVFVAESEDDKIDETPQTLQRFVAPIEHILDGVL